MIRVIPAERALIPSFYETLCEVARERIYLEMIEPPSLETVTGFQTSLIEKGGPVSYAVEGSRVVGWADVFPSNNPRHSHRGSLGMGILKSHRGQGLGTKLLRAVIDQARTFGLEKIELQVYTSNPSAIGLYRKFGFTEEGLIKSYRKLDGITFDSLSMALFL